MAVSLPPFDNENGAAIECDETLVGTALGDLSSPSRPSGFAETQRTFSSSSGRSPTHLISERFRQIDSTLMQLNGRSEDRMSEVSEFAWFENMGYSYVRASSAFAWSILATVQIVIGTRCANLNEPVYRLLYFILACGACTNNGALASLGSHGKLLWQPVCAGISMFLFTSLLMLFGFGFGTTLIIGFTLCIFVAGIVAMRNARPGNLPWRKRGAACTVVTILSLCAILVSYSALSQNFPILGAVYLSVLVPSLEILSIWCLKAGYQKHVFTVRHVQNQSFEAKDSINSSVNSTGSAANPTIKGDQKLYLSLLVAEVQAAMEGTRFAALLGGVVRDPNSNAWAWAVCFQFFIDTALRTTLLQWMVARFIDFARGSSKDNTNFARVLYIVRWITMPSAVTFLFQDLKFTLGYPRFVILIVSLIARSWQMEKLDDAEEMNAALVAGGFMLMEEVLEDICVALFQYGAKPWLDWSSFQDYERFCAEHPNQVVDNPSLHYVSMPQFYSALIVFHSVVYAYIGFCSIVGERWVIGVDVHYKGGDNTIWWCSSGSC